MLVGVSVCVSGGGSGNLEIVGRWKEVEVVFMGCVKDL